MKGYIDDVPVYDGVVYFDDWLKANGYKSKEYIKELYASTGMTSDECDECITTLWESFIYWAEHNNLIPMEC